MPTSEFNLSIIAHRELKGRRMVTYYYSKAKFALLNDACDRSYMQLWAMEWEILFSVPVMAPAEPKSGDCARLNLSYLLGVFCMQLA